MTAKFEILLRPMSEPDRGMVAKSWLTSYARSSDAQRIPPASYFPGQAKLIDKLIDSEHTMLAVEPLRPTQIYGWICGRLAGPAAVGDGREYFVVKTPRPPVIHYVYVKGLFRRAGIGRLLVNEVTRGMPAEYSHQPPVDPKDAKSFPDVESLVSKLAPGSHFNPYWIAVDPLARDRGRVGVVG